MNDDNAWLLAAWNAVPWNEPEDGRVISARAGFDPGRTCEELRSAIRKLRELGFPIASNSNGYWKTTIASDLATCIRQLHARAVGNQKAAAYLLERISEGPDCAAAYEEKAKWCFDDQRDSHE